MEIREWRWIRYEQRQIEIEKEEKRQELEFTDGKKTKAESHEPEDINSMTEMCR